jgi:hypothetical protein
MGKYIRTRDDEMRNAISRSGTDDFGFLPEILITQCRALIQGYHDVHGFACLPDILWKSRLQPLIEQSRELNQVLRKASTARRAKKANQGFVQIAATILSLEILASSFSGWGVIYPEACALARAILNRHGRSPQTPLMDFYLYPPKYLSAAAIATLAPPSISGADFRPASGIVRPEMSRTG